MLKSRCLVFTLLALLVPFLAQAQDETDVWTLTKDVVNAKDHPAVGRFPGSVLFGSQVLPFTSYRWPRTFERINGSWDEEKDLRLEGRLTRLAYHAPAGKTTLDLFANYRNNLKKAGYAILAGGVDATAWCDHIWENKSKPFSDLLLNGEEESRGVLYARSKGGTGGIYVGLFFTWEETEEDSRSKVYIDILETQAMEAVEINADDLGNALSRTGKVAVYGILFNTDSATIQKESENALKAMVEVLLKNPGMNVFVVGHTDNTGGFEHNMKLSAERAASVVSALVARGIGSTRMKAHGVGCLSPVASNRTEEGRGKNRRVELVVQ